MRRSNVTKPRAVRRTVVQFCKKHQISVREFTANAKKTRLKSDTDASEMEKHYNLWLRMNLVTFNINR